MTPEQSALIKKTTRLMVDVFSNVFHKDEEWEIIKDSYMIVVASVVSSVMASIVNGWAKSITDNGKEHKEAVEVMVHLICADVLKTMDNFTKSKLH